jgi:hypothetical protein
MALTQTQTRQDLRVSIGRLLGVVKLITAAVNGTTTTFVTDSLPINSGDDFNGKWLVFTGPSNNDGTIQQVIDSTVSTNRVTLTTFPAITSTATADTAELWDQEYDPNHIHELINQAIKDVTGYVFDPTEDISLFADGKTARFDIPTTLEMLRDVYIRTSVQSIAVHDCDSLFDETDADSDYTDALDDQDRKQGGNSIKLTVTGSAADGDFVTDEISSVDLSKYTHLEGWVKAENALAANDFAIKLDSGVVQGDGTDLETVLLPATTADETWTYFRVALTNPWDDTAIVSVGLEYNANAGLNTIWIDDIKATVNDEAGWVPVPRHLWGVDKEARDLIFIDGGEKWAGYGLLKLVGGDNPLLLTADGDTNEVPDSYIIYKAAGLALMRDSDQRTLGQYYLGTAETHKRGFQPLVNARLTQ